MCDPGGGAAKHGLANMHGRVFKFSELISFRKCWVVVVLLFQLASVQCFVVQESESQVLREDTLKPSTIVPLLVGDEVVSTERESHVTTTEIVRSSTPSSVSTRHPHLNATHHPHVNGSGIDTFHHEHQWGRKNGTHNCSKEHEHSVEDTENKIEQILWDIFVDEDESTSQEEEEDDDALNDEDVNSDTKSRDDETSDSSFEATLSDEEDSSHERIKRSSPDETGRSVKRQHKTNGQRVQNNKRPGNKKNGRPVPHKVSSRRHTKPRTKSKGKKKNPTSVSKYNEYMDVVLKRMNGMIKTKKMDPLMVNLFSGAGQQGGNRGKEQQQKKPKAPPKKKNKKGYTGWKKRKGAKNKGRMEDLVVVEKEEEELEEGPEGRSGSSDSDSSDTIELDHQEIGNGVQGVGGVFIRRVGVAEDSDEEEEDEEDELDDGGGEEQEEDNLRSFREIRALIVNGSMKRSGNASPNETSQVSPSTTESPPTKAPTSSESSPQETRGFDKPATGSQDSSEESPRKKGPSKKPVKKPQAGKGKKKNGKATRGVLKGLSSLKRYGDVDVVRQSDNVRIVRGRFSLGPVTLEIVPRGESHGEGRKKKNKQKSAEDEEAKDVPAPRVTAIARELKGIIEVRLKKNNPTTIKRLRVFPPSSVKIKSNGKSPSEKPKGSSVPRYNRVTPVATHRLRQIASAVVRQADVKRKSSGLESQKRKRKP